MKNNLENSIKESLKGYEVPYNAAAWTAMNAKLDAKMPVGKTGGGATLKWVATGAAVLAVAGVSYFSLKSENSVAENSITIAEKSDSTNNSKTSTQSSNEEVVDNTNVVTSVSNEDIINETNLQISDNTTQNIDQNGQTSEEINEDKTTSETKEEKTDNNTVNPVSNKPSNTIEIPSISDLCAGETINVENSNDLEMTIEGPNYSKTIDAGSSAVLNFVNTGSYRTAVGNKMKSFTVKALPAVDFSIDTDNKFENGLPSTLLVGTSGSNLEWSHKNGSEEGNEIDVHFFKKGHYPITLTSTGANGCSNSITKDHYVSEDYNLMAVNAFIPGHHDPQRSTFMPFALMERNVKFNLIVLDPTDGHTVFQTNDSSNGWNGVDKRTGMQVSPEKLFIWKVTIENPERGESNEYAGNIIPISK